MSYARHSAKPRLSKHRDKLLRWTDYETSFPLDPSLFFQTSDGGAERFFGGMDFASELIG